MSSEHTPTGRRRQCTTAAGLLLGAVLLAGCGPQPVPSGARVYFVEPQPGATVASPFPVVFGAENIELGAVPVNVWSSAQRLSLDYRLVEIETPRQHVIHHHLGIDTECLPSGTFVPHAAPWLDFSDAATQVRLDLPPGQHTLVLQAGDDEHRAANGLCTAITITVRDANGH